MSSLVPIFRDKLIPWSADADLRMIVARLPLRAAQLPDGVRLEKRSLRGRRDIIKNHRSYQNTRSLSALWPDHHLNEVSLLKMACVLEGAVDYQLGKQAVLCGPGHFILIPPGTPHPDGKGKMVDAAQSTFCRILYFLVYPNALQCWEHRYEKDENHWHTCGNYLFVNDHLVQLSRIVLEEIIAAELITELHRNLWRVFLQLTLTNIEKGQFQESISGKRNPMPVEISASEDFIARLNQYIQSHLQDRPTLEKAAQHMYYSRTQFARRVRQETGKTFVELLNECRVETAKDLLSNSDWTVNSIATFVGYQSSHYLHTLFRRKIGVTPDRYRLQVRKYGMID